MPNTRDFILKVTSQIVNEKTGERGINAEIQPTPTRNCDAKQVRVNGQVITKGTKAVGDLTVTNFEPNRRVSLRAPKDHPPITIEIDLDCERKDEKTFSAVVRSDGSVADGSNALTDTTNLIDLIVGFFKKIADAAGRLTDLPGDVRDGLKKLKALVGKGLDIASNLLPGLKLINPALALVPDNLEHLKKKIGEHLKDLDPLDDSREAALADAEALRLLILEDIIPYVQQVGAVATNDLQQYTQRLSVMRKMTARLGDQLDLLSVPTKQKRRPQKNRN